MSFRKIDVDAYDEGRSPRYRTIRPRSTRPHSSFERCQAETGRCAVRVEQAFRYLFASGETLLALSTVALDSPPYGLSSEEAKNLTLQTIVSVLNSTKSTDVPTILRSLSQDEQDTLMKYIYKGMGMPGWGDVSGSVLLGWHEKLTEIAGTGCIVRVMTDRRTV
ncbi:actin-related protein ARPC5 [Chiua virens]|nr:actin-related protein ARPC5 [Chiua virens]